MFLNTQIAKLEESNYELYQQLDAERWLEREAPGLGIRLSGR